MCESSVKIGRSKHKDLYTRFQLLFRTKMPGVEKPLITTPHATKLNHQRWQRSRRVPSWCRVAAFGTNHAVHRSSTRSTRDGQPQPHRRRLHAHSRRRWTSLHAEMSKTMIRVLVTRWWCCFLGSFSFKVFVLVHRSPTYVCHQYYKKN